MVPVTRALEAVKFCLTSRLSAEEAVDAKEAEAIEPEIVIPPVAVMLPDTDILSSDMMPLRATN